MRLTLYDEISQDPHQQFVPKIFYTGLLNYTVNGDINEPLSSTGLTRTSYARGDGFGCSHKFFRPNCWKYCTGSSGKWCYTVSPLSSGYCMDDNDCRYSEACQGWCAWNSQSGCSKACHEEIKNPQQPMSKCRRGQPYWLCQSSKNLLSHTRMLFLYAMFFLPCLDYENDAWRSGIANGGKWISADIPNEHVMNGTANTITATGNSVTSTKQSIDSPQTALWYPIGQIKVSSTTFYWTFTIRQTGTSSIDIGLSDINKLAPGWRVQGLFFGGNLSDGSGLLIGKKIQLMMCMRDKVSIFC